MLTKIPTADLEKIELAYESNDANLPEMLKVIIDEYGYNYYDAMFTSTGFSFDDISDIINPIFSENENFISEFNKLNENATDQLSWLKSLKLISEEIGKIGGMMCRTILPIGGSDSYFILFKDKKYIKAIYILAHFYETTGMWVGCYDELSNKDTSYEDFVKEYGQGFSGTNDFELITNEGPFGPQHNSNINILNINRDLYNCAIAGMKAGEKFCK